MHLKTKRSLSFDKAAKHLLQRSDAIETDDLDSSFHTQLVRIHCIADPYKWLVLVPEDSGDKKSIWLRGDCQNNSVAVQLQSLRKFRSWLRVVQDCQLPIHFSLIVAQTETNICIRCQTFHMLQLLLLLECH